MISLKWEKIWARLHYLTMTGRESNFKREKPVPSLYWFPAAKVEVVVLRSRRALNAQSSGPGNGRPRTQGGHEHSNQEAKSSHSQEAHNPVPVNSKLDLVNPVGAESRRPLSQDESHRLESQEDGRVAALEYWLRWWLVSILKTLNVTELAWLKCGSSWHVNSTSMCKAVKKWRLEKCLV